MAIRPMSVVAAIAREMAAVLIRTVKAKPDITMPELAVRLLEEDGWWPPRRLSHVCCAGTASPIKNS